MSEFFDCMPDFPAIVNQLNVMDLRTLASKADEDDSCCFEEMPEEPSKLVEEQTVAQIFEDFGNPPPPPPVLPSWLTEKQREHAQQQYNLDTALHNSQKQKSPGLMGLQGVNNHMEKLDHKHRMGFLLAEFLPHWQASGSALGFFQWLDEIPYFYVYRLLLKFYKGDVSTAGKYTRMFMKGVQYLDNVTRKQYRVVLNPRKNNMLFCSYPLDTTNFSTVFNGKGWAAWVLSSTDKFYTGPHIKGEFHHSSFLSGGMVKAAGEWKVEKGRLQYITGKTGHYQCPIERLVQALNLMQSQIGLSGAYVRVWDKEKAKKEPNAMPVTFPVIAFLSNKTMQDEYVSFGMNVQPEAIKRTPMIGTHRAK